MPNRDQIIATIEKIYEARVAGDKDAISLYWSPDATFRIAGSDMSTVLAAGPTHPDEAIGALIDQFRFHSARIVDAQVEANRAAVHMEVAVSTGGGQPVMTELVDLWEFDDTGRAQSLRQFIDTALAGRLAAG